MPDPHTAEIAVLRAEIGRLEKALADAGQEAQRAVERAREEGRRAGREEAVTREAERIAAVRDGMEVAQRAFAGRLDLLDGLAAGLARAALEKIFEPAGPMAERVTAMLARQLGGLRRESVVAIRVSARDFEDSQTLAALGGSGVEIAVDPELPSGAARIRCRLGGVDLDLREHWSALSQLLESMAGDVAA